MSYRQLFEQSPCPMLVIDAQTWELIEFNDGAADFMGYSRPEFSGLTITDFEMTPNQRETREHIARIRSIGSDSFHAHHRSKNGDARTVDVSINMMSWMQREAMLTVWHPPVPAAASHSHRQSTIVPPVILNPKDPIVAISSEMQSVIHWADRIADTELSVLLQGETGAGKELIAKRIHDRSSRRQRVFMPINCGALPKDLVDGELFGSERGAYTGADQRRLGRFEAASGGTVFLDEVGELELSLQTKLLRALQEGEIHRLGASETTHIDIRVIAATNRDLRAMVREGSFREDLYHRLNGVTIDIPPLRGRAEDIREIVNRTIQRARERTNLPIEDFSEPDKRRLERFPWSGNVRELLNVVNRSVALMENGKLTLELWESGSPVTPTAQPEQGRLDDVIRSHLVQTLEQCAWVIEGDMGAAARLGVAPSTLRSQIKRFGVVDPRHC